MEIWKPIPGYEGIYEASSFGRIRTAYGKKTHSVMHGERVWKQRILKYKACSDYLKTGYRVTLWKDKKPRDLLVARLVCTTFHENLIETKMTVNHKDGNRLNNRAENLEWLTIGDNIRHGFKTGLYKSAQKRVTLQKESGEKLLFQSMSDADKYLKRATGYVSGCLKLGRFPKSSSGETYIVELEEIDDGIKAAIEFK